MEKKEYKTLYDIENDYWLYVGLRDLIFSYVYRELPQNKPIRLLDAGCGTGVWLEKSKKWNPIGIDHSKEAIRYCKLRNLSNLARSSISKIPFKNDFFDIVISLDVLYHMGVKNDEKALDEMYRVLKKGGKIIINLPAYNFLRSEHDEAVHTKNRYTLRIFKHKIEKSGFTVEKISYRNTVLFPAVAFVRIIKRTLSPPKGKVESDFKPMLAPLNKLFTWILYLENKFMPVLNYPFGVSLFCVARK